MFGENREKILTAGPRQARGQGLKLFVRWHDWHSPT
jgi:hypothetical protein